MTGHRACEQGTLSKGWFDLEVRGNKEQQTTDDKRHACGVFGLKRNEREGALKPPFHPLIPSSRGQPWCVPCFPFSSQRLCTDIAAPFQPPPVSSCLFTSHSSSTSCNLFRGVFQDCDARHASKDRDHDGESKAHAFLHLRLSRNHA